MPRTAETLPLIEAAARTQRLSSLEFVERCLAVIGQYDAVVRAWCESMPKNWLPDVRST
jgi:hypothetical protein